MKKITSHNTKKLMAYSAMAAAFISTAEEASADIVYVDITDVTFVLGDAFTMELDGDGVTDFAFALASNTMASWTYIQGIGFISSLSIGASNNMMIGYSGPFLPYASALNSGNMIGSSDSFISNANNVAFLASVYSGVTYGPFANTTDKYIGVKFDIAGETHYGWIRVDCTVDPVSMTIKDWAYDDIADTPIPAGAMLTPPPTVSFETDASIVNETAGLTTVHVNVSAPDDCSVDVSLNAALSTATNGTDFIFSDPETAIFTAGGTTTYSFDISIADDALFEGPETIVLDLNTATGCDIVAPSEYTITIDDDEVPLPPVVQFDAVSFDENEDAGTISLSVSVDESTDCSIGYTMDAGLSTATSGSDFTSTDGTLTFISGGPTTQSFDVNIIDDAAVEATENITFEIISATGTCMIGDADTANVNIIDNDVPPPPAEISFSFPAASIAEASTDLISSVGISESADCSIDLIVNAPLSDATNGSDFNFSEPLTLNFTAGGATSLDFTVGILEDAAIEPDEHVVITLGAITGPCVADDAADNFDITILNDDNVGVDDVQSSGINLYSYNNTIYLILPFEPKEGTVLEIADEAGRIISREPINSKQQQFAIGNIASGMYVARIIHDKQITEKKLFLGQ